MNQADLNRTRDIWNWFNRELTGFYPEREAHAIAAEVFKRLFDLPPDQRVIKANHPFTEAMLFRAGKALSALMEYVPVQYVTGVCSFLDAEIRVTRDVLIPRPETEELVIWAAAALEKHDMPGEARLSILDVGTGSGCIAIALARRFPEADVQGCDLSGAALKIARKNSALNQAAVTFFKLDILHPKAKIGQPLDCIISNPPYVRMQERTHMEPNVLNYEPCQALFVPDEDPLLFYRAIARQSVTWLNPGGHLFLEINEAMENDISQLLSDQGFEGIYVRNDFKGKPRFVHARKQQA
jgi:release factor glutamine methyltransferase